MWVTECFEGFNYDPSHFRISSYLVDRLFPGFVDLSFLELCSLESFVVWLGKIISQLAGAIPVTGFLFEDHTFCRDFFEIDVNQSDLLIVLVVKRYGERFPKKLQVYEKHRAHLAVIEKNIKPLISPGSRAAIQCLSRSTGGRSIFWSVSK